MREKAKAMLSNGNLSDPAVETWYHTTLSYIKDTFGSDTRHISTFCGSSQICVVGGFGGGPVESDEQINAKQLRRQIEVLDNLIAVIEMEDGFSQSAQSVTKEFDFWSLLHPEIVQHAKPRFEVGQFADSVEAALKHVNAKVKDLVRRKTSKELDGASLMRTAFSPNSPVVTLEDLSTDSGKNIQQGYMDIFAGAMTGIRNPKAHDNVQIDSRRATHMLFLASLLLQIFDERI